jgi:hypothetical protein
MAPELPGTFQDQRRERKDLLKRIVPWRFSIRDFSAGKPKFTGQTTTSLKIGSKFLICTRRGKLPKERPLEVSGTSAQEVMEALPRTGES